jgi:hypothetical protein
LKNNSAFPVSLPGSEILSQTARGAQKAFERLSDLTDYDWEEGGDAVRKIFEFEVREGVYKTEEERLDEEEQKRRFSASVGEDEDDEEENEAIKKQKQKEKEKVKQGKKAGGNGGWDLKSLVGAKAEGSKMKPSRTVGVDGKETSSSGEDVKVSKGMEERLERIEDALEILLTEMVRNRRLADGKIEGSQTAPKEL